MAESNKETQNSPSRSDLDFIPRKDKSVSDQSDFAKSQKKGKDDNRKRMETITKSKFHKGSKLNNYGDANLGSKEDVDGKKTSKDQAAAAVDQQALITVSSKKSKKLIAEPKKSKKETVKSENKAKKSKKKKVDETTINQSGVDEDVFVDDGHVMQVIVHRSDRLKFNMLMSHPVVSVSLVDANTGSYVKKSDKNRPVISRYETTNEKLDYIQPVLTMPFDFKHNQSITPVWEDSIVINEAFNHFVQPGAKVILFFKLMDFVGAHYINSHPQLQQGWFTIAWAFLQLVGANESANWGGKVRLQLYKVPNTNVVHSSNKKNSDHVEVFQWWSGHPWVAYPSTLYVTVNKVKVINDITPSLRSLFPLQEEAGLDHILDQSRSNLALSSSDQANDNLADYLTSWSRLPGQSCQIPRTPHKILPSPLKGCSFVKFSRDGRFLACGCQDVDGFPLIVYEVPSFQCLMTLKGHLGIIYDICWTKDSKHVVSTSADGSVRVWSLEMRAVKTSAFHPSFLYAAQIEPNKHEILITGGYDRLIRVWLMTLSTNQTSESNSSKLLQELNVHTGYVNAICFHPSGTTFYSGDATGSIMMWSLDHSNNKTAPASLKKEIKIDGTKGVPITSLDVHPLGHRLLVQSRNNKLQIVDLRVETCVHKLVGLVNINSKLRSCFSPDGSLAFSGSEDGRVYVWSTESGNQLAIYNDLNFNATVSGLDSHPLDDYIAFCCHGYNQPIKIYKYDPSEPANQNLPREGWKEAEDFNTMVSSETKTDLISMAKSSADNFDFAHSMRLQAIRNKLIEVTSKHSAAANSLSSFYGSNLANQLYNMSPSHISSFDAVTARPSPQPVLTIAAQDDKEIKVVFKPSASTPMKEIVVATENYSAQRSDELTFSKGDTIVVLHKDNNFWWMGHMPTTMKQGFFPANMVTLKSKSLISSDQSKVEVQTNPSHDSKKEENKHGSLLRQKHPHPNSRRNSTTDSIIRNRVSFNLGNDNDTRPTSIGSLDPTNQDGLSLISSLSAIKRGSKNLQNLNPILEEKQQNVNVTGNVLSNGIDTSIVSGKSLNKMNVSGMAADVVRMKPPLPSLINTPRRTSLSYHRELPDTAD